MTKFHKYTENLLTFVNLRNIIILVITIYRNKAIKNQAHRKSGFFKRQFYLFVTDTYIIVQNCRNCNSFRIKSRKWGENMRGTKIKQRLVGLGKTQRWLCVKLKENGFSSLYETRLCAIIKGSYTGGSADAILDASERILDQAEKAERK